jgi:hypothetical protein
VLHIDHLPAIEDESSVKIVSKRRLRGAVALAMVASRVKLPIWTDSSNW